MPVNTEKYGNNPTILKKALDNIKEKDEKSVKRQVPRFFLQGDFFLSLYLNRGDCFKVQLYLLA